MLDPHATPSAPASSGRRSPLDELKRLEAIVYGVPSPESAAATEQLLRLMQTRDAERLMTRPVIDAAPEAGLQTVTGPSTQPEEPETAHPEPQTRHGWHRFRRGGALASVAAIGVLLGAIGGALAGFQAETPAVDASGALAIFDEPQLVADLPPNALNATQFGAQSFRALMDSPPVYVARGESGKEVCLVLVQPTGETAASCVDAESFPESGLNIKGSYQHPGTVDAGNPGAGTFSPVDVTWLPDGNAYSREPSGAESAFGGSF
ncbi:hypothetical protein [Agreia bicolorata]|uniref:Anti-sigma factor n=1 Tax=Agreia bicolorata TaxID=110935 RepID=A0ABR5CJ82_9MICO|nr:hypothetical protein [Agreia bicolorata]KJC65720.1 hypothetical protein TZ00_02765 [Agreia bicolorata]